MLKWLSLALVATGILHNTLAFILMGDTLRRLWRSGLMAAVRADDAAAFALLWFIVAGFALMLIGAAFWQLADAGRLGWSLILGLWALAAGICLLFPQPGPFLLLALACAFVLAKAGGAG
ncbi:DUF6463 family protein [Cardiobacterium valvarum]|uniref:Uncharacterized protein n=1 Tax=Cardiobacterium valvarum TaxID=194702 RepID=A0A381EBH1_9GAMM|nr:DUF6463 family protein [Cardiobacterium valvarum]SUX24312.1 Uncharacterised protein [Cardiobacterium valvarum]